MAPGRRRIITLRRLRIRLAPPSPHPRPLQARPRRAALHRHRPLHLVEGRRSTAMRYFKRYFITGLLIWIPLVITVWVIATLINALESLVPTFLSPQALFGRQIPEI